MGDSLNFTLVNLSYKIIRTRDFVSFVWLLKWENVILDNEWISSGFYPHLYLKYQHFFELGILLKHLISWEMQY